MNRDKKWLLREFRKLTFELQNGYAKVKAVDILPLIDQLDEPEKVVVPQFVADALDYDKNPYWEVDEAMMVAHILRCAFGDEAKPSDFLDWVRENPEDYVMVVKNGHEVEKEPLYYVKFISNNEMTYLNQSNENSYIFISIKTSPFDNKTQFTEQEIKSINEHYWQFAELVEETP